jgi:hypothetical protein
MAAPSTEMIALARQRYADGIAIAKILAETGMSLGTLYLWLDGGPNDAAPPRLPRIERRRTVLARRSKPLKGDRVSLVNRLWRASERQVRDIEDRLRLSRQQPDERERDARMLAIMVKTLRELRALSDAEQRGSAGNDDGPDNLDDFRRELARKIDGIIARRGPGTARGSQG